MLPASEEWCGEQEAKGFFHILEEEGLLPVAAYATVLTKTFLFLDTQLGDIFQTPS